MLQTDIEVCGITLLNIKKKGVDGMVHFQCVFG